MKGKECIIETMIYEPDSEICDEELCFVCKDGVWQEKRSRDFNLSGR